MEEREARKTDGLTIRFLWVRLITRCSVIAWSLDWDNPRGRLTLSLAVLSSSSSSSAFLDSLPPGGDEGRLDLEVSGLSLRIIRVSEARGCERRVSRLSPALSLPVELVAGGEGRPECVDEVLGLGGSGRSGRSEGEGVGPAPRKIADNGRRLDEKDERDVIEWKRLALNELKRVVDGGGQREERKRMKSAGLSGSVSGRQKRKGESETERERSARIQCWITRRQGTCPTGQVRRR